MLEGFQAASAAPWLRVRLAFYGRAHPTRSHGAAEAAWNPSSIVFPPPSRHHIPPRVERLPMRSTTTLLAALVGLLAVAGVASAQETIECPECDEDVPAMDDCTYSSYDTGYVSENYTSLLDTDACVHEADEHGGWWATFSLCIVEILTACGEMFGVFATLNVFASEDGVDVDGGLQTTDGLGVDFEDTPLGDLDDATWENAPEGDLPTDLPADLPTDDLPAEAMDVDECVYGLELAAC